MSCPSVVGVNSISVQDIPEARGMVCENCTDKKLCDIPQSLLGHVVFSSGISRSIDRHFCVVRQNSHLLVLQR